MFDFLIYICSHGETKDLTVKSLDRLHTNSQYRFEVRYIGPDALIGRSRSLACTDFLRMNDALYMIFVDSDMAFGPEEIEKIYQGLCAGYPIVAGGYSLADGKGLAIRAWSNVLTFDNTIQDVEYVSTGFFGISRKCLETIRDKTPYAWIVWDEQVPTMVQQIGLPLLHKGEWCECYPFFESGMNGEHMFYLSEDWDMCQKARRAGLRTYFHTGALVAHIKDKPIMAKEAIKASSTDDTTPILSKCFVHDTLVEDLIAYLKVPAVEVMQLLNDKPADKDIEAFSEWKKNGGNDEDFYRQSKTALLDLVQFNNRTGYWQNRIAPLKGECGKTILDIGCGIGSAALFLATQRNKVMGLDINANNLAFANFRKERFGLVNVMFVDKMPEDLTQFDLVTAIDTLEHIEDLEGLIKHLGQGMKQGAKFYHFDMFYERDPRPQHHKQPPELNKWFEDAGFLVFDDAWAIKR